jgi:hypothetical protein
MIKISWSRFDSFDKCRLQYSLRYIDRVKMPVNRSSFLVGSVVHDTIKEWAFDGYPQNFVVPRVTQNFNSMSHGMNLTTDVRRTKLKQAIKGALLASKIYHEEKFVEHRAVVEQWFEVRPPVFPPFLKLIGGYDVYDPHTRIVYDLKMHTSHNYSDFRQLLTYAVALATIGEPVSHGGYITPLLKQKVEIRPISNDDIIKHANTLVDAGTAMELKNFEREPMVGRQCYFCEFNRTSYCPATMGAKNDNSFIDNA